MTHEQASGWLKNLSHDDLIKILCDYHTVKNGICERVLGVPTGTDNWIHRAGVRANHLRNVEANFAKLVREVTTSVEECSWNTREVHCSNCMGTGKTTEESCCICKGTGYRKI